MKSFFLHILPEIQASFKDLKQFLMGDDGMIPALLKITSKPPKSACALATSFFKSSGLVTSVTE